MQRHSSPRLKRTIACMRCREKKLKCDRQQPCSTCIQKGEQAHCRKAQRKKREIIRATNTTPADNETITDTIERSVLVEPKVNYKSISSSEDERYPSKPELKDLIRQVAQVIGTWEECEYLINDYFRVHVLSLVAGCVHIKALSEIARKVCFSSATTNQSDNITEEELALIAASIYLAKRFKDPFLRNVDSHQEELHRLAKECLKFDQVRSIKSFSGLQTIIILLVTGEESIESSDLFDRALRFAELQGYHLIEELPVSKGIIQTVSIEEEMIVRAWWFLVTRSWLTAQSTLTYRIVASQNRTRLPINGNEESLLGYTLTHEWSPASYLLVMIRLATVVRDIVDMVNTQQSQSSQKHHHFLNEVNLIEADEKFDLLVEGLPHYFSIDAEFAPRERTTSTLSKRIECERWLIHQQLFDLQLKLHFSRDKMEKPIHASLILLANHILNIHDKVRQRCPVFDALRLNHQNVLQASLVVMTSLKTASSVEGTSRFGRRLSINAVVRAVAGIATYSDTLLGDEKKKEIKILLKMIEAARSPNSDHQARRTDVPTNFIFSEVTTAQNSDTSTFSFSASSDQSFRREDISLNWEAENELLTYLQSITDNTEGFINGSDQSIEDLTIGLFPAFSPIL